MSSLAGIKKEGNEARMNYGLEQPTIQTAVLSHSLVRLLAPLTLSLAPNCSLRSRPPLCSLVRSPAHVAHSLVRGKVNFLMSQNDLVLSHSAPSPVDQPSSSLSEKASTVSFSRLLSRRYFWRMDSSSSSSCLTCATQFLRRFLMFRSGNGFKVSKAT